MIAEAIEKIQELVNRASTIQTFEHSGRMYADRQLHELKQTVPMPPKLGVGTLRSLVDFAQAHLADIGEGAFIHVQGGGRTVNLYGPLDGPEHQRPHWVEATSIDRAAEVLGQWRTQEAMVIHLQTLFQRTETLDAVMKVVGLIVEEDIATSADDGRVQTVTAVQGIQQRAQVSLPPVITLRPYRTFPEVDQPEAPFVLRLKRGPLVALFEADGGAWDLQARSAVGYYVKALLDERGVMSIPVLF